MSSPDIDLISKFVFGSGFTTFTNLLFKKMDEGNVGISEDDYRTYVDDSVMEMSTGIIEFIKEYESNPQPGHRIIGSHLGSQTAPKASATASATPSKCKFIITRGINKGSACNKPAVANTNECSSHSKKGATTEPASAPKKQIEHHTEPTSAPKKAEPTSAVKNAKCSHVMVRGARQGELCGATVKDGCDACTTHSKAKTPKHDVVPASKNVVCKPKDIDVPTSPITLLRKDKVRGIIYHPDTGFVIKSQEDKSVIGRVDIENGKPASDLRDLSKNDIDEINKRSDFKINEMYTKKPATKKAEKSEERVVDSDAECEEEDIQDILNDVDEVEELAEELAEDVTLAEDDIFEED
jgi:hypothetical protein